MFRSARVSALTPVLLLVAALALAPRLLLPPRSAPVGPDESGGYLVPTLETIHPAGTLVNWGGRPVDLARSRNGDLLYVKDNRGLILIDTQHNSLLQELPAQGGTSMHGIAATRDGKRVYLTNGGGELLEANISNVSHGNGSGNPASSENARASWGRRISLTGTSGGKGAAYGCGVALSPDESMAYVCLSRHNSLAVVNLSSGSVVAHIPVGVAPYAVTLSPDGRTAYISDWGGRHPARTDATGKSSTAAASKETTKELNKETDKEVKQKTTPTAKALQADSAGTPTRIDGRGVASDGAVSVVDLSTRQQVAEVHVGLHPSDMVRNQEGTRLYVANANSDTVSVLDTSTPARPRVIETISCHPDRGMPYGSMPNALALSGDGKILYVANGGNNAVVVIALAANEGEHSKIRGLVPTGWYPGALALDDQRLYVANIKGFGSRGKNGKPETPATTNNNDAKNPAPPGTPITSSTTNGWNVYDYLGNVNAVALAEISLDANSGAPSDTLRRYTAQVRADSHLASPNSKQATNGRNNTSKGRRLPLPDDASPSTIEHVVYILKENRTYDQVLGDLTQGNGDKSLAAYGRVVTPNHHALAEQFVLLDNYYCNGVLSADGHSWATEGNCTDHLEKAFGGFSRSYTFGDDPLTYSSSGFLWDRALAYGRTFRNYGEMDYAEPVPKSASFSDIYRDYVTHTNSIKFTHSIGVANLRRYTDPEYPGWNMRIPDVVRADIFIRKLRESERSGKFPNLTLIYLPNDHTSGTAPGGPTPRAQVADNDLALGRIVQAISNSSFWARTCIFVNEDDPQDGRDHVDGHRSLCLVIGPYVRRGAVVHDAYNQTAVLHTMERMLGVPPMNQKDAHSPLMRSCFMARPDMRPYVCRPNQIPLDETNPRLSQLSGAARRLAERSMHIDLSRPDAD